jgi:hypothetical protein
MRTEPIHMAVSIADSSLRKEEHNVLNANWSRCDEVPRHVGVAHIGLRVSLSGVDNVGELNGILNKEEWCIVAHKINNAFFCVKFDSETTRIAISV